MSGGISLRAWLSLKIYTRLLVHPAPEHPHIAHIGAEHDVEGVTRQRHDADHAIERHIAQHPRRDMPGRAERARLAHQPQRNRRRDDVADHRDQADQPVDAVADIGARQDEGDVEQLRQRLQPRQPLLAGEIAERVGAGIPKSIRKPSNCPRRLGSGISRPSWSITGPRALRAAPVRGVRRGRGSAKKYRRLHGHQMVTQKAGASCVKISLNLLSQHPCRRSPSQPRRNPLPSLRATGSRERAPDDRLAKQSIGPQSKNGFLRRFAPLRKRFAFVAGNDVEFRFNFKQQCRPGLVRNCARGVLA